MNYVFHFYLQSNHEILFEKFKNNKIKSIVNEIKESYHKRTDTPLSELIHCLFQTFLV